MSAGSDVATYRVEDGIAVLTISSPPVNALGHAVRIALCEGVARALADASAQALVLICAGRTFFAGADVTEIGKPILPPLLKDVMALFESATKPIVSAMHGTALGGGLELALACHYRVAVPSAVVGLPEVALGLLPGAGGTQRIPRLIGVAAAVEMIGLGKPVDAQKALALGLLDAIVAEEDLERQAIAHARQLCDRKAPLRRVRDLRPDLDLEQARAVFAQVRAGHPELFVGVKAADGVLRAIEAAITLPFDQGVEREREISRELTASPESAAQRHLFFAERTAAKLPGHEKDKAPIISAVMLAGEWEHAAHLTQRGLKVQSPAEEAQAVIATLPEDPDVSRALLASLPAGLPIILTNHLEALDTLAAGMADPGAVVGLAVTGGVAEVVVGVASRPEAALTAAAIARKAGWPAIFVGPAPGLILARLAESLQASIAALRTQGVSAAAIAATGKAFGFDEALLPQGAEAGVADAALERRLLDPVLAEARTLVEAGIARRASDVDFAMVRAGLWPLWRGGPAFLADRIDAMAQAAS